MKRLLMTCILAAMALPAQAMAGDDQRITMALTLDAAVRHVPMELTLRRGRLGWEKIYFRVARFNASSHQAVVTDAKVTPDRIELELVTRMASDAWIKGGWGRYRVTLVRQDGQRFAGTYEGTFWDVPLTGAATARVIPGRGDAGGRAGQAPVEPTEHPRLLFRKGDLPALRAKAQTPFGQAALARMQGVIGTALRYQLEGDRKHAEAAIQMVRALMADENLGDKIVRGRVLGWRMEQVALAYDLCYDAWPPEFRAQVERYIVRESPVPFTATAQLAEQINWNPLTTYPMPIRYGPALGVLAIWGMPGEKPVAPRAPAQEIPVIEPDPDFVPGEGVTVCDFRSDTMPSHWLIASGFADAPGVDLMASLGGGEQARPGEGTEVTDGRKTGAFRVIAHDREAGHYGGHLDLARASGRQWHTTALLYTVVRVDQAQVVQVRTGSAADVIYLGGRPVRDGELVKMEPGVFPLLLQVAVGKTNAWGQLQKRPRLAALTGGQAEELQAKQRRDHASQVAFHQVDARLWENSGGMDLEVLDLFGITRQSMAEYLRSGFGDGGFMRAAVGSLHGPNRYAVAYRNAFCEPVTPEADLEMYLPRQMFVTFFQGPGQTHLHDLRGDAGFAEHEYGGTRNYLANYLGALFPLVPEKFQPTVLWGWWQYLGITKADEAVRVLDETFPALSGYTRDAHLAWTFVHYPMGMEPVAPAGVLPLTWKTDGLVTCGFRNKWTGEDACAVQVAVDCGNQAPGAFVLAGFGAPRLQGRHGRWTSENVVQLPGVQIDPEAGAVLTHHAVGADGSGSVAMDYGRVYRTAETGVAGSRAVAVDYSGKSGATALLVVADRVSGFDDPVWSSPLMDGQFVLARFEPARAYRSKAPKGADLSYPALTRKFATELMEHAHQVRDANRDYAAYVAEREGLFEGLTIEGDTFRIERDGVILQGRVFSNRPVQVKKDDVDSVQFAAKMTVIYSVSSGIVARGGNEFLVVMTVSKGAAPRIGATGSGLGATVTVGDRQVTYDGRKVVIR